MEKVGLHFLKISGSSCKTTTQKNISSQKQTEKLQACVRVEFHLQNFRKGSSQSAASSYKQQEAQGP